MRKLILISALLFVCVFTNNKQVFGWGSTGGDGSRYAVLQETAVFFNNSGTTLTAGDVVILDTAGTGVAANTTLGSYVTTTANTDSILVVGVVQSRTSADQTPVAVVTAGPVNALCLDASDAVSINAAVGTGATAGKCGGGINLGLALEAGDGTQGSNSDGLGGMTIWVSPTGAQ